MFQTQCRDQRTSSISLTPEYDRLVLVLGISKDIMKINSKSIKMPNVQGSEIMMECIIEKGVIDAEVVRRASALVRDDRGSINGSG
jgi:hypothetical protein